MKKMPIPGSLEWRAMVASLETKKGRKLRRAEHRALHNHALRSGGHGTIKGTASVRLKTVQPYQCTRYTKESEPADWHHKEKYVTECRASLKQVETED